MTAPAASSQQQQEEVPLTRDPNFWADLAKKFNEDSWVPQSIPIPSLDEYAESMSLPFLFPEGILPGDLARTFGPLKHILSGLVEEANRMHNPTPGWTEDDVVEHYIYPENGNTKPPHMNFNFPDYIWYLWEFANQKKMLGSCIANASDRHEGDVLADGLSSSAEHSMVTPPLPTNGCMGVQADASLLPAPPPSRGRLSMVNGGNNNQGETNAEMTDLQMATHVENFLQIQELHLNELKTYHTM
eukprot:CAMPEP_0116843710 /NCGR_PEP_ID=MMETSP0418-20121206/12243_1 /TAXON_ID=1158023 /ORGANISM="Astrosyne radiata, Strain 13vi08-1A" /LENGTH=243 /DNA_ID=CAMNT_0004474501 /DNA_START=190 /DNA_END=921 /DNA_ORIENTATION=-